VLLAHCHIRPPRKLTILETNTYLTTQGYYQSFAFLVTPGFGVTLSYSQTNELNTATAVIFLTWSIWFTFTTSLIALRSEYTIYLTLIFASVAITTGLVGTSHLVTATSEQVPAFRLQRVQILPCCEKIRVVL
jgi:succinate-acetate transporter protein